DRIGCIDLGASGGAFRKVDLARSVRIARDALLLRATDIDAPREGVIRLCHRPVVDELEVILSFLQRTVALVDVQRIAEAEASIAVDVERWHSTGLGSAQVQPGYAGVGGWGGPDPIGIDADAVAVKAEAKVGHDGRTDGVDSS